MIINVSLSKISTKKLFLGHLVFKIGFTVYYIQTVLRENLPKYMNLKVLILYICSMYVYLKYVNDFDEHGIMLMKHN